MGRTLPIRLLKLAAGLAGLIMLAGLAYATAPASSSGGQAAGKQPGQQGGRLVVFAAASLKNALDEAASTWKARNGADVVVSYAGSSRLAQQIAQGAPADVFVSANADWMGFLKTRGAIVAGSEAVVAGNRMVLIAHAGADMDGLDIAQAADFEAAIRGILAGGSETRLAMAMVDAVPAGIYGKTALQSLGLWEKVRSRVVQGDNVRSALVFVSRGEVDFGLVYASDVDASLKGRAAGDGASLRIIAEVPGYLHHPIVYPAAVLAHSANTSEARAFVAFLASEDARGIFAKHGFERPGMQVVNRVR